MAAGFSRVTYKTFQGALGTRIARTFWSSCLAAVASALCGYNQKLFDSLPSKGQSWGDPWGVACLCAMDAAPVSPKGLIHVDG
jgi:hypothetical protein